MSRERDLLPLPIPVLFRVADAMPERLRLGVLLGGVLGMRFHGTRVTGLTWSYRLSGGSLKAVQAIGGHTSSKTALRYQRADVDYLAAVAANVSNMIERTAES